MGARKILTFVIGCVTIMATSAQRSGNFPDVRSFHESYSRSADSGIKRSEHPVIVQRFHFDPEVAAWDPQNRQIDASERGQPPHRGVVVHHAGRARTHFADQDGSLPIDTGNQQQPGFESTSASGNVDGTTGRYIGGFGGPAGAVGAGGGGSGGGGGRTTVISTTTTLPPTRRAATKNLSEDFSRKLLQVVLPAYGRGRNMVYSPISLQMLLGLFYIGARGMTQKELKDGAVLDENETGPMFKAILDAQQNTPYAQLRFATLVLYNKDLVYVQNSFKDDAMASFQAQIEEGDFSQPYMIAESINSWVSDRTDQVITNLLPTSAVDAQTQAVAITVVYFKARWAKEFSKMDTAMAKFHVNSNTQTDVQMMYNDDTYYYADLPKLKAKAIELPYRDSNISMMIILPNEVNGLQELEDKLGKKNLNQIAAAMSLDTVTVRIPQFKISFDVDLEKPLRQLNINRIFGGDSELTRMFDKKVKISKIQQKAVITVNEAGSEAAASSYAKFVPLSLPVKVNEFTADHPFVFAIRSPDAVLIVGHVINPHT